jgi:SHAQKYF class myb-like DNA-binding protein
MYGKKVPYKAIVQYGKEWKKVEQYVKTRTGSQVRSHAQKFFNQLGKINPT